VIGYVARSFDGAEVAGRDSDVIVRDVVAKVDGGVRHVYWFYSSSNVLIVAPNRQVFG
jgi:hypothetical protein